MKVVLIPVLLGILINWIFGKQIQKISEVLPLISVVSIVMIISGIVSVNAEKILSCGLLVLGVVALHNLCGMGIGLGAAKLLHIEYDKATAIAIEVGMQNSGLAISLATANFAAIHWQRFRERSSVYGIIYQALYSPGSAVAELVRKKLAWK